MQRLARESIEAGFAADPEENVAAVIAAGAVGINLEDGTASSRASTDLRLP